MLERIVLYINKSKRSKEAEELLNHGNFKIWRVDLSAFKSADVKAPSIITPQGTYSGLGEIQRYVSMMGVPRY